MFPFFLFLLLVTVILAQYPTAPRYGVSTNSYGYGNYYQQQQPGYGSYYQQNMNNRQYYQNQYAMQNYYNDYNRYYNNYYRNYYGNGYNMNNNYNSYARPAEFMGFHQDQNGNYKIGNDIAAFYLTCNGRGCPARG